MNALIRIWESANLSRVRRVGIGLVLLLTAASTLAATISTFAGSLIPTGLATSIGMNAQSVLVDAAGDLYFSDNSNHVIRKVDHITGIATVIAGTGKSGSTGDGGPATSAALNTPRGIAFDSAGNLYIADSGNQKIRQVDTSGNISTVAGTGSSGNTGDGGPATSAKLSGPQGVAVDTSGNLYIADSNNSRIRKVDTSGTITTFAGTTTGLSGDGGAATSAQLSSPRGLAFDSSGNLYVADTNNHRIRKIDTGGTISTVAGTTTGFSGDSGAATAAQLKSPQSLTFDGSGNFYIADTGNSAIRKVSGGNISTVAGTPTSNGFSGDGGAATSALLFSPQGVAVDATGNIYIADSSNVRVRKVDTGGTITTYAGNGTINYGGDGGPATSAQFGTPQGIAVDSAGNVYLADSGHNRIRKVDTSGTITTFAGDGTTNYGGDGGPATSAQFNSVLGVAVDSAGNVYIADGNNNRIRKVDTSGTVTTVAGSGVAGFLGDGGAATSARINAPFGVWVDSTGNLYIADTGNQRVRKVDTGGTITTIAGTGVGGYSGDGGPATSAKLSNPMKISVDAAGNVYIDDYGNSAVRKIDTSGNITTVAGTGSGGLSGDGGPATSAQLSSPRDVFIDAAGNLYIADTGNSRIRMVDTSGTITTFAGTSSGYSGDGGAPDSAQLASPQGLVVTASSNRLYISDTSNRRIRLVTLTPSPISTTGSASSISATGAVLNGTVDDNSQATSVSFDYGLTTAYGTHVAATTGGTIGAGAGSTATAVTLTGLACGTTYHFRVSATSAGGTTNGSDASFTTSQCPQTITFNNPGTQTYGTSPTLAASSDSGLTPTFSSATMSVCTITSGGTLTLLSFGTCTIHADQAGDATYAAAVTVSRSFAVSLVGLVPQHYGGATATGSGNGLVSVSGGGGTCDFAPQGNGANQSAFFIPVSGHPKSPTTPPPSGLRFPEGLLDFVLAGCTVGNTVTLTVIYPQALSAGTSYWKFGPTATDNTPHWYVIPAVIAGNTVTFSITDGGLGDDDLTANGTIVDQGGPAVSVSVAMIPTLQWYMQVVLGALCLLSAAAALRARSR